MSDRLSFIHDYVAAREALLDFARVIASGASRYTPASGDALSYAAEVKAKLEALHEGLVATMSCHLVPEATLRLKFRSQVTLLFAEYIPHLPEEVSAPAMVIEEAEITPEELRELRAALARQDRLPHPLSDSLNVFGPASGGANTETQHRA